MPNPTIRTVPLRQRDRRRLEAGEIAFRPAEGELFVEAPKPTDALQGFIGDCYYLSALSALARADAARLRELIRPTGGGAFSARFFRREADGGLCPETVTIDAQVPVRVSDGRPIYARARARSDGRREAWPLLLEKAYAAWKGGYDVMGEGGLVASRTT